MTLTELTPLELNKYRFSGNHTPLTPENLSSVKRDEDSEVPSDKADSIKVE